MTRKLETRVPAYCMVGDYLREARKLSLRMTEQKGRNEQWKIAVKFVLVMFGVKIDSPGGVIAVRM